MCFMLRCGKTTVLCINGSFQKEGGSLDVTVNFGLDILNFSLSLANMLSRHTEVRKWKNPPVLKPKATDWEEILTRIEKLSDTTSTSFLRFLLNHMNKLLGAVSWLGGRKKK